MYSVAFYVLELAGPIFNPPFTVMLQPIDLSLPDSERSKHKFMVQTMFAPPDFLPDQIDTVVSRSALNSE